jgi:hypothetical protein
MCKRGCTPTVSRKKSTKDIVISSRMTGTTSRQVTGRTDIGEVLNDEGDPSDDYPQTQIEP